MIVTGRNPVFEALKSKAAKKIYVRKGATVHFEKVEVPFEVLSRGAFESQFGEETQGVAALVDDFQYADFKTRLPLMKDSCGVALLDQIQDPHNFGAVIRAAHCFGITDIIVPRHDQARVTPSVYKASAGALFYCNITEVVNLGQAVDSLKDEGFAVACADMEGDTPLYEANQSVQSPIAVIIGSEGKGIRESILDRADVKLRIPMKAKIDSLNASMSAAVIFYELFGKSSV